MNRCAGVKGRAWYQHGLMCDGGVEVMEQQGEEGVDEQNPSSMPKEKIHFDANVTSYLV